MVVSKHTSCSEARGFFSRIFLPSLGLQPESPEELRERTAALS
jgi:hypothetical protein